MRGHNIVFGVEKERYEVADAPGKAVHFDFSIAAQNAARHPLWLWSIKPAAIISIVILVWSLVASVKVVQKEMLARRG